MKLSSQIKRELESWHMLKHPFYQAWTEGSLSIESLQNYCLQYRPFVDHFPRYVAAIISQCENPLQRKQLLCNLLDEEGYPDQKDHPSLWKDFSIGMGINEKTYNETKPQPWAFQLHKNFWLRSQISFHESLASLYAYESQIPEVSKAKIEGLRKYFNITDAEVLKFFFLHEKADLYHSECCEEILDGIIEEEKKAECLDVVKKSASDLWNFLTHCHDGLCNKPNMQSSLNSINSINQLIN